MKKILGLDLGTNSIGWAVVNEPDEPQEPGSTASPHPSIAAAGSRIIPMDAATLGDFDKGNTVSQTKERTGYRSVRRLYERHHLRRDRLHRVLDVMGYLPEHYAAALDRYGHFLDHGEPKLPWVPQPDGHPQFLFRDSFDEMLADFYHHCPDLAASGQKIPYDWTLYYLRKKALTAPIDKYELAWLLLNFNQKRGYSQSRDEATKGDTEDKPATTRQYFDKQVVTEIIDTGQSSRNKKILVVVLADGSRGTISKKEMPDWVGKEKSLIATVEIDKQGRDKYDEEGHLKLRFEIPTEDEWDSKWALVKLKTERDLEASHQTVGAYIYDALLHNPAQKIKGKLVRVIERKYYKEELRQILNTQQKYHPELTDRALYADCIRELYPTNDAYRESIAGRDFIYLLVDDILFYQRPLKSKKFLIADCPYEQHRRRVKTPEGTEEYRTVAIKCIAVSHPLYQEFRLWQFVGNLRIFRREQVDESTGRTRFDVDVTSRFLPDEESRAALFDWLNDRTEVTQKELLGYPAFNLGKTTSAYRWNYVDDDKKAYPCNTTRGDMLAALKKAKLPATLLTAELEEALWQVLYAINNPDELKKALRTCAEKHGLAPEAIVQSFGKFKPFAKDYGAYSAKAIKRLLALMRMGHHWSAEAIDSATLIRIDHILTGEYDEDIKNRVREKAIHLTALSQFRALPLWLACYIVYNRHSEAQDAARWTTPDDIDTYLRNFRQHSMRNPIVELVVLETLRTVRDIWRQEGHIDEIHIELGREIKKTAKERARMTEQITENENTNLRIKALLTEFFNPEYGIEDVRPYSPSQQELLRIYEDGVLSDPTIEQPDFVKEILAKFGQREASKRPTSTDIMRYKLWLEQKYRSPYTGQFISLSKLFTSAYEIEHIIPQARYFDDSMSNKVICESEVNKLKDKSLGYEFIQNHHSEKVYLAAEGRSVEIFSVAAYDAFVKEHYSANRGKLKRLLMEDIPDDFIARQMNDSRYISRMVMTLLSNIVREEGESEAVSKHLIPCNGNITDRLKKDWGVGDVWNRIILSRFERMNDVTKTHLYTAQNTEGHTIPCMPLDQQRGFNKKRIDHRHHAMDAIVIACTTRNMVNYLNNESARAGARISRYDLQAQLCDKGRILRAPWPTFAADVYNTLSHIVVSFKQNLRVINKTSNHYEHFDPETGRKRMVAQTSSTKGVMFSVRKPLHKATYYGLVNLRLMKTVPLKEALARPQDIVEKDFRIQLLQLQRNGYNEEQIVGYFNEHNDIWHEIDLEKIKVYYYTQSESDGLYTAVRVPLETSFKREKIETITDTGIQKILLRHLDSYRGVAEEAFSPEGIESLNANIQTLNDGKPHKPIYSVRLYKKEARIPVGTRSCKGAQYVKVAEGTNLFFAIYEQEQVNKKTGLRKRIYATIPLRDSVERMKRGLPVAPPKDSLPARYVLAPGDLVYLPTKDEIKKKQLTFPLDVDRIYKMISASSNRCTFIKAIVATPIVDKVEYLAHNNVECLDSGESIKEICIPIRTDRLGNILPLEDFNL
jgi:CRISPR-associated endonuclease Csn1